ncbi:glycoside hydrolase family 97 catalytic domain-containing protein [bacterium]|nr:glycoside hydrolase family 97 catalytic domain-containing protein [bacterium]
MKMKLSQFLILTFLAIFIASGEVHPSNQGLPMFVLKVNCGGDAVDGALADKPFSKDGWGYLKNGSLSYSTKESVKPDCGYPQAIRSFRCDAKNPKSPMRYLIHLPNGTYTVKLIFAELIHNKPGMRLFDVYIQNKPVLRNYDVFRWAKGKSKGKEEIFKGIKVSDGVLQIDFLSKKDRAIVNVIEIISDERLPPPAEKAGYTKLVFWDDFNSIDTIDIKATGAPGYKWYIDLPWGFPPTSAERIKVQNSMLKIDAGRWNWGISSYSVKGKTGRVFRFGYFEAKIRFDQALAEKSSGWPSFWSLSLEHCFGDPTHWNELDFFEAFHAPYQKYDGAFYGTIHDCAQDSKIHYQNSNNRVEVPGINWNEWHIIGCLWQPGCVIWFLDNKPLIIQRYSPDSLPDPPQVSGTSSQAPMGTFSIIDKQRNLIILGSGENWPLYVDWVRVYQSGKEEMDMKANPFEFDELEVKSPDGRISLKVKLEEGKLVYWVEKDGEVLIEKSPMGIFTSVADFTRDLSLLSFTRKTIEEKYPMIGRKKEIYENHCNELVLKLGKKLSILYLVLRAYNDGVAYRYHIPGEGELKISFETSGFRIPESAIGWAHPFTPNYEAFYPKRSYRELLEGNFGMPVLLNVKDNWLLLTEAAVYGDYCGSHIEGDKENGILKVVFAPDQKNAVVSKLPFYSPWRVAMIGSLADIVESTLIENLNPDCEIADTSWIKPGRSAWSWLSGDSTEDYETQVKYVDFAHKMGWEYYLCDEGWKAEWLPKLVEYAKEKGIGIFVWYHYKEVETDEDLHSKFSWLSRIGVKGVKVDFFDSDCQERIQMYDKVAKGALQYKLMVVYHGATKPSGERRRWPHILTREGVLGAEYYKWSEGPTAEHNCTLPFTRNALGPMDYTPVTFSNMRKQTTYAHQLALAVVFESNIQHLADKPEAYESIGEAIEFLKDCPATWDDTKLLEGYPGRFVTIARRSGNKWFIGAICGGGISREADISLEFLEEGREYIAEIYRDGDSPEEIIHEKKAVRKGDILKIPLKTNGGCAIEIKPSA